VPFNHGIINGSSSKQDINVRQNTSQRLGTSGEAHWVTVK
jgi:hypothetical protein